MDFTFKKYTELLTALRDAGYSFVPYCEFVRADDTAKIVCLRHDVDLKPQNSLKTAEIEAGMGIQATYYFRAVPESWDENIIKEIASLGHEIGYHYESLTTCHGNIDAAYQDFCQNLTKLRTLISSFSFSSSFTICMHGSPRSPYDSKDIWKKYSYKDLGILAEPYLDTDWSETFYLTDTGRRWDGFNVSVRDKIPEYQDQWTQAGLVFHSTDDIIQALQNKTFLTPHPSLLTKKTSLSFSPPCSAKTSKLAFARASFVDSTFHIPNSKLMITSHPQRWTNNPISWLKELLLQNVKNIIKSMIK